MRKILAIIMALMCLVSLCGCGSAPLRAPYALLDGGAVINYEFTYARESSDGAEELFIAYFADEDKTVYMITAALPPERCAEGLSMSLADFTDGAELRLTRVGEEVEVYSSTAQPELFTDAQLRLEGYSAGATAQEKTGLMAE